MSDYLDIAKMVMRAQQQEPAAESSGFLEAVLKGRAVELWSDSAGRLFLVSDEEDAARLGEPRGTVYTAAEAARIVTIADPDVVAQVHLYKRTFDGVVRAARAGVPTEAESKQSKQEA